jgi:cobalamin biosynthesis protein CobD/CbiB
MSAFEIAVILLLCMVCFLLESISKSLKGLLGHYENIVVYLSTLTNSWLAANWKAIEEGEEYCTGRIEKMKARLGQPVGNDAAKNDPRA